ncbi:MAG: OmpH family outer membrane protein [Roseibacillus sp.]|nr:OmpH family outer membrane protein [Roseibacillus sp.]
MRRLIYLWVGMGALLGLARAQEDSEEQPKAAIVNIQKLFKKYYKAEKTQEEINLERARIQKEHNDLAGRVRSMDEGLRQLETRLQKTNLEEEARASLEREKGLRQGERESLDRERRTTARARHGELNRKMVLRMENLLEEIREIVVEHAERTGYDLVFDVEGLNSAQVPVLLFAKDATDITPMILKELNKNAPSRG